MRCTAPGPNTVVAPAPKIGVVMMLKNEELRVHVSLESIRDIAAALIIYDTGSTDRTMDIVKQFATATHIPLHLETGTFVDFATSRNVILDYADTVPDLDFLLLLDCNDELQGSAQLRATATKLHHDPATVWLVRQQWAIGNNEFTYYYNARFLRPRTGWRYKGVVHEYLYHANMADNTQVIPTARLPDTVMLFQDRTKDDNKTQTRFANDYRLLKADLDMDPTNERSVFYLAQTCACMGSDEEAYKYYVMRGENESGFQEERFEALYNAGKIADICARRQVSMRLLKNQLHFASYSAWYVDQALTWETALGWYMKAMTVFDRIEPLIAIARFYCDLQKPQVAYMYAHQACTLPFPQNSALFLNKHAYDYDRWHLLTQTAYHVGKFDEGMDACVRAIEFKNLDVDKTNLDMYRTAIQKRNAADTVCIAAD